MVKIRQKLLFEKVRLAANGNSELDAMGTDKVSQTYQCKHNC